MKRYAVKQLRRFARWVLAATDAPIDHFANGYKDAVYRIAQSGGDEVETHPGRASGARSAIRYLQALREGSYERASYGAYLNRELKKLADLP